MDGPPEIRIPDPENPEKTGKPEILHMTYQIKALGKLVNVVLLKIRISGFQIRKGPEKLEKY